MSDFMNGGIFRSKEVPFSQISNKVVDDENLSCIAKGLYLIIQRNITIPNFVLYKSMLKEKSGLGAKAFDKVWKELKEKGYLIQERHRDKKTRKFYYVYDLLDEPNLFRANLIKAKNSIKKEEILDDCKNCSVQSEQYEIEGSSLNTPNLNCIHSVGNARGGKFNNTYTTTTTIDNAGNSNINNKTIVKRKYFNLLNETTDKINNDYCKRKLEDYLNKGLSEDVIELAIREAIETTCNNFNIKYLSKILDRYLTNKIFTQQDYEKDKKEHENKKRNQFKIINEAKKEKNKANNLKKAQENKGNVKKDSWNFNQRQYDFNELEARLLGWEDSNDNDYDITSY